MHTTKIKKVNAAVTLAIIAITFVGIMLAMTHVGIAIGQLTLVNRKKEEK